MSATAAQSIKLQLARTEYPILRAGKANILLAICFAGLFVVWNLLLEEALALKGLGLALTVLLASAVVTYLRALSRLEFRAADVIAEGPISRRVVPYDSIERVNISISRLNPSIKIKMHIRGGGAVRRGILGEITEWGGLEATGSRIGSEFELRGVTVSPGR